MTRQPRHEASLRARFRQRTMVVAVVFALLAPTFAGATESATLNADAQFDRSMDAAVSESAGMPMAAPIPAPAVAAAAPAALNESAMMPAPIAPFSLALSVPSSESTGMSRGTAIQGFVALDGIETRAARDAIQQPDDLWERIRTGFAMPNLQSKLVNQRQHEYSIRPHMMKMLVDRSRRYLFHIVEEIEKRGLPTELALLPMVESAFNPMAYSRAHASGLWQFIPSTGRDYNLEQNWWYDARRDVVASTSAALEYLQKIYEMHGNWHLALASYNFGEWGVARMVERNRRVGLPMDFSSLKLPTETRHYVPRLQALKNIIADPGKFGIDLEPIPNAPYFATVTLTEDIDLELAARLADMSVEELIALNPGHNRPVVSSAKSTVLVLPADRLDTYIANLAAYDKPLSAWQIYGAQRGERLEQIAAKHKISVDQLRQVNGIRGTGRLQTDARLLVPTGTGDATPLAGLFKSPATISAEFAPRVLRHIVKAGETWQGIAARYSVRMQDLQAWNGGTALSAGQSLTVQAASSAPVRTAAPKASNTNRPAAPATPNKKPQTPINVANR